MREMRRMRRRTVGRMKRGKEVGEGGKGRI
jgi:hypothetical protein